MFRNTFHGGFLPILNSTNSKPLENWGYVLGYGHVCTIPDFDIQSMTVEVVSLIHNDTSITCPACPQESLGVKLPIVIMAVKNLEQYFTFEVEILDHMKVHRVFRAGNIWSTTRVKPLVCVMPMRMANGWNQIQLNLADFTKQAYGTKYVETVRVRVNSNCRIRNVFLCDKIYPEPELPPQYKIYLPYLKRPKKIEGEMEAELQEVQEGPQTL